MSIRYSEKFRRRVYEKEMKFCKKLGIEPCEIEFLRNRSRELNRSGFTSEVWFKSYLKKLKDSVVISVNYPVLNRFYADFFIEKLGLVIEIDGKSHDDSKTYDLWRDGLFKRRGLKVFRIRYHDEMAAKSVVRIVAEALKNKKLNLSSDMVKTSYTARKLRVIALNKKLKVLDVKKKAEAFEAMKLSALRKA